MELIGRKAVKPYSRIAVQPYSRIAVQPLEEVESCTTLSRDRLNNMAFSGARKTSLACLEANSNHMAPNVHSSNAAGGAPSPAPLNGVQMLTGNVGPRFEPLEACANANCKHNLLTVPFLYFSINSMHMGSRIDMKMILELRQRQLG